MTASSVEVFVVDARPPRAVGPRTSDHVPSREDQRGEPPEGVAADAVLAVRAATEDLVAAVTHMRRVGAQPTAGRDDPSLRALLDELARLPPLIVVLAEAAGAGRACPLEGVASSLVNRLVEDGHALAPGSNQDRSRPEP